MKSLILIFSLFLSVSLSASTMQKDTTNQKIQRYNIVTNINRYYVFVNDSLTGEILKNATIAIVYKGDTLKGERVKYFSPDYPFSFQLVPDRKVKIISTCPEYKSATYDVTMSKSRQWFESQLTKEESH